MHWGTAAEGWGGTYRAMVSSKMYQRVQDLFESICDLNTIDRAEVLKRECADDDEVRHEVEALLAAHDGAGEFLEHPTVDHKRVKSIPPSEARIGEGPGTVIGRYKLLQQIGEGGFGVVFMAQQVMPVKRKVALKIIKLGMDTKQVIARFEAERQALAMMDHPNIAAVLDGGATDTGRPYFVMELVRGDPITEYCDRERLSAEERLQLFKQVCYAIQHAHQKGIIHRDLKPSNVLVTMANNTPLVKVIDFGIAKATNSELTERTLFTEFRQLIGTPEYMSPEQSDRSATDIDTRSDIYSLGVLLYELLTGTTPVDTSRLRSAAWNEIEEIIRDEDPPVPSSRVSTLGNQLPTVAKLRSVDPRRLGSVLKGELDWIVMKALDKDRNRRYQTAISLAHDIDRFIKDQPVEAGPPTAGYRLSKFMKRFRAPLTAAALVLSVLLIGLIST
ncbi:MAG: serine/threonine-protein kinase, partial [Planctomycetota bacterium]